MMEFNTISQLTNRRINSQQEFDDSDYAGVDEILLKRKAFDELLFARSEDNEEVFETYYFLEANAEHLRRTGNIYVVAIDDVQYCLVDMENEYVIAIHRSFKDSAMQQLT